MNPTATVLERRPCGTCLNCRNGFAALCLKPRGRSRPAMLRWPGASHGNSCNLCGAALPKRRRYCNICRTERRRQTWRRSQDQRRSRLAEGVLSDVP